MATSWLDLFPQSSETWLSFIICKSFCSIYPVSPKFMISLQLICTLFMHLSGLMLDIELKVIWFSFLFASIKVLFVWALLFCTIKYHLPCLSRAPFIIPQSWIWRRRVCSNCRSDCAGNWMIIIFLGTSHQSLGSSLICLTCRFCNLWLFDFGVSAWFYLSYWYNVLAEILLTIILKGPSLIILAHVQIWTVCKHLTLTCSYSLNFDYFGGSDFLVDLRQKCAW